MANQVQNPRPFVAQVLRSAAVMPAGRWQGITYDAPVAGKRGESVSVYAVRALTDLAEGKAQVRYVTGANPAFVATITTNGRAESVAYRLRDHSAISTSLLNQAPSSAVVFAAALLAGDTNDEFSAGYAALLDGIAADLEQGLLDERAIAASSALIAALEADFDLPSLVWTASADISKSGEMDEANDPTALPLDKLFSDAATFAAYRNGDAGDYALLRAQQANSTQANDEAISISADAFVGVQKDVAVRFMRAGKHILHHGPTGTGKSFVWDIAMSEVYGEAFDPQVYPYFVHGSAGLEDIDFIGNIVPRSDGTKVWVDGPLVRAMKDGKRLKVEEMNRLPAAMLNVLLGAMDYGRIAITRHEGEVIVAAPGFAVDAMANIGREYTATDEIDPAVMRRFHIKVEYDFLAHNDEVALLRSRHNTLEREDAETLVRIATAVREAYEFGGTDLEVDLYVSPAALLQSAELVSSGSTIAEAIELTWLADVARTKSKRERVRAMIDQNLRDRKVKRNKRKTA